MPIDSDAASTGGVANTASVRLGKGTRKIGQQVDPPKNRRGRFLIVRNGLSEFYRRLFHNIDVRLLFAKESAIADQANDA